MRFLRAFVDARDLAGRGFRPRENAEGAPHYALDLLLKVWLYGYWKGMRSTRRLEEACRDSLPLVWLTGRHTPDHNTLWRFFRENRRALREVFRAGVRVAAEQGLIGMVCHICVGKSFAIVLKQQRAILASRHFDPRGALVNRILQEFRDIEPGVRECLLKVLQCPNATGIALELSVLLTN